MSSSTTTAFFGATGGCTNACLAHTLNAGYQAVALARTPSKLTDMLLAQGISQTTLDAQLKIVKGDIADVAAVKRTLLPEASAGTGGPGFGFPSHIISGIGGAPKFQASLLHPVTLDNPTICQSAMRSVMTALREIYEENPELAQSSAQKPLITIISSTGVDGAQDVPFGFRFFYHVVLKTPHADKRVMEQLVKSNVAKADEADRLFRGVVGVRPSLLTGDQNIRAGKGWEKLRVGVEPKPAVGHFIHKADVGQWLFEEIVKRGGQEYVGKDVTLTN